MDKHGPPLKFVKNDKKKRRRRILLVVRWPVGGIRTFMSYVYSRLDPHKYKFTIVAPEVEELNTLLEDLTDLHIQCITVERRPSLNRFAFAVSNALHNGRYDVVHSHGLTSGFCSSIGALVTGTPHILTLHDIFLKKQFEGTLGLLKKIGISIALLQPDIIHCVSHDALKNLLSFFHLTQSLKKNLIVIPHGIETSRFLKAKARDIRKELNLSSDTFLIGFFGRFMSQKGFKYLIDAIDLLYKESDLPKKPIVIAVGDGGFQSREKKGYYQKRPGRIFCFHTFHSRHFFGFKKHGRCGNAFYLGGLWFISNGNAGCRCTADFNKLHRTQRGSR